MTSANVSGRSWLKITIFSLNSGLTVLRSATHSGLIAFVRPMRAQNGPPSFHRLTGCRLRRAARATYSANVVFIPENPSGVTSFLGNGTNYVLAAVPEPARSALNKIREAIRSVVPPESTEVLSYKIPAFKHKKVLVWYAAFTDHCACFQPPR